MKMVARDDPSGATPMWFGPEHRPLLGWLHLPEDGCARAAIVLCPPLGREAAACYRTYRVLASQLAAAGFGVLRFDYAGTGDSAGSQREPHQVEGWLASVRAAIDLAQTCGARRVVAIGMRMGATLAAVEVSRAAPLDALVLWDACISGRSFLHEQQALQMFRAAAPPHDDGRVETPGFRYSGDTVKDMASLEGQSGHIAGGAPLSDRDRQRRLRRTVR
jgi:alpha-beta hydrolase superfamily lysophospholipase